MTVLFLLRTSPLSVDIVGAEGEGVRLRWTHVDGGGGPAPCGCPHRQLKLEFTDIILSTSHAKKLASFFYQNFVFGQKKVEIFLRHKLVIYCKLLIVQFKSPLQVRG